MQHGIGRPLVCDRGQRPETLSEVKHPFDGRHPPRLQARADPAQRRLRRGRGRIAVRTSHISVIGTSSTAQARARMRGGISVPSLCSLQASVLRDDRECIGLLLRGMPPFFRLIARERDALCRAQRKVGNDGPGHRAPLKAAMRAMLSIVPTRLGWRGARVSKTNAHIPCTQLTQVPVYRYR